MVSNRKSAKVPNQNQASTRKQAKDKAGPSNHGSSYPDYMFVAYKIKLVMWSVLGCQFVLLPILILIFIILALYYMYL